MLRVFLTICLTICCCVVKAQSANMNALGVKGLQATFSAPVLAAYQENAKEKVADLFQYLQLLADASTTEDLKKEVERNIYILFKDRDVLLPDFFNDAKNQIKLSFLIEQLKKKPLKFKLSDVVDGPILFDSWQMSYKLQILNRDDIESLSLTQTVHLSNDMKTFGSTTRNVWQIHLGIIK